MWHDRQRVLDICYKACSRLSGGLRSLSLLGSRWQWRAQAYQVQTYTVQYTYGQYPSWRTNHLWGR